MDSLQITTGEKHLPIVRDGQAVGEIVFNPNSATLAEKYYRLVGKLEAKMQELESLAGDIDARTKTDGNGIPDTALEIVEFAKRAHVAICEEYDFLFGPGTSAMVFGDFIPITEDGFAVHRQFVEGFAPYFKTARADKVKQYTNPAGVKRNKRK